MANAIDEGAASRRATVSDDGVFPHSAIISTSQVSLYKCLLLDSGVL